MYNDLLKRKKRVAKLERKEVKILVRTSSKNCRSPIGTGFCYFGGSPERIMDERISICELLSKQEIERLCP
jgi:hypothetical protein